MSPAPAPLPRISVVVTCFNYAHYVAGAIESALSQSHANKEIVVVNDGSADRSADVSAFTKELYGSDANYTP